MGNNSKYDSLTSFIDLVMLALCGFVALFVIAMLLIQVKKNESQIVSKVEYLITTEWPDAIDVDMDSWLMEPSGHMVNFKRREDGLMHLDRDDRGTLSDTIFINGEEITVTENREIVSIRGIVPGEYIFNIHYYRNSEENKAPVPVTVKIEQISPYKIVYLRKVVFNTVGEEQTIVRFTLDNEKHLTNINQLFKSLTKIRNLP